MGDLDGYLRDKDLAIKSFMANATSDPKPIDMAASVEVRGRSGVRAIKIRQFEMISDTAPDTGGFDLSANSPEYFLAALGGCIAHTALMVAAGNGLSINTINVDVHAQMHPLAQTPGYEDVPNVPHNLRFQIRVSASERADRIEALYQQILQVCPVYNLISQPQPIFGELIFEEAVEA